MYKHTKGDFEIEDDVYRVHMERLNPGLAQILEGACDRVSKAAGFEPLLDRCQGFTRFWTPLPT